MILALLPALLVLLALLLLLHPMLLLVPLPAVRHPLRQGLQPMSAAYRPPPHRLPMIQPTCHSLP